MSEGYAALESLLATGGSYTVVLGSRAELEPWRYGQLQPSLQSSNSVLERLDCDFARYTSVYQFAEIIKTKYAEPIDVLVLCAGKISSRCRHTVDGQEETLQVNVLSHALLIELLALKLGVNGTPCRILMVGSSLHRSVPEGTVSPANIDTKLSVNFDPMEVYHITKLIQVFLMYTVQERFNDDQRPVSVVVVSPGGRTVCRGITQNFPSGTYFSQRKIEETAEETYNMELRHAWTQWFISKNVWKPEFIEAPAPPMAPLGPIPAPGHVENYGQGQELDQGQWQWQGQGQTPMMPFGQSGSYPPQTQQPWFQMPGQGQGQGSHS
ncbi:hypothetical protein FRB97_003114 [Tulasnella sp. 331]|nr:hypothetical protein FRB97_003114 [Tulasnella sp. 331]